MAEPIPDFERILTAGIEEIYEGIKESENFNNVEIGEVTFKKLSYPCVQILPGEKRKDEGSSYNQPVEILFIFRQPKKGIRYDDYYEYCKLISEAMTEVWKNLYENSYIGPFEVLSVEPFM